MALNALIRFGSNCFSITAVRALSTRSNSAPTLGLICSAHVIWFGVPVIKDLKASIAITESEKRKPKGRDKVSDLVQRILLEEGVVHLLTIIG